MNEINEEKIVYSVSQFNNLFKEIIDETKIFKNLNITGELSNFKKHISGNYFFNLIDDSSSISCVIYSFLDFSYDKKFKTGDKVIINGNLTIFNKRGTYNIVVNKMSLVGEGDILLNKKFLIEKLTKEGIISEIKKDIPKFPNKIAILTGDNSAAYSDLIKNISNRYKNCEILFFPTIVQGKDAVKSIINSLEAAKNYDLDLLILARGGGSSEDLSAFDDENVVRSFAKIKCPKISAIGHEIDVTVCDYVADLRVSTPTAAAIASVPNKDDLLSYLDNKLNEIYVCVNSKILLYEKKLSKIKDINFFKSFNLYLNDLKNKILIINEKISNSINLKFNDYSTRLNELKSKIEILNPENLLSKGYAIIKDNNNRVITSKSEAVNKSYLNIKFIDGSIKVKEVKEHDN
ncbi:MAG: exodeoxyribonuclease VII large subunit [Firmicutes bacterium]|nr:exodeoxyribonuclease VII large subunit [Candidatus Alectryobacillus merdavium]